MENPDQNINQAQPVPPVVQDPPVSSPINPPINHSKSRLKLKITIGSVIVLFLFLGGVVLSKTFYGNNCMSIEKICPDGTKITSSTCDFKACPAPKVKKNLNPKTGNLYEDIKIRLKEELK